MFIGDVGGGSWEEVNRGTRGANYGWPICEGPCTSPHPELANPIYSYSSDDSPCNAITGGYIVRDSNLGALYGRYLFTDACTDLLRSINPAAPPPTDGDRSEGLSANAAVSLGEDACGRLYVVAQIDAQVFRVEGSAGGVCPLVAPDTDPPETTLELKRKGKRSTRAKFTIDSDEPGSTFECKLDKGKWKSCGERRKAQAPRPRQAQVPSPGNRRGRQRRPAGGEEALQGQAARLAATARRPRSSRAVTVAITQSGSRVTCR